jgi:hypothetical protein
MELVFAVGIRIVLAAILVSILRIVGAILRSRPLWIFVLFGCVYVGSTTSTATPLCIGVGIIALVILAYLSTRPRHFQPVRSRTSYNFPVQAEQVRQQSMPNYYTQRAQNKPY